ncbi:MAG: glycosyltransferase family A protein [Dehalococcoidia bacterium]
MESYGGFILPETPALSAIICTRNRPDFIGAAVASVLANVHTSFEVIVVDQSDDDSSQRALDRFADDGRLRYIHRSRPGISAAANAGVRAAAAETLCFTDDDCRVPVGWLSSIEAVFEREPGISFVSGQMLMPPELKGTGKSIPTFQFDEPIRVTRKGPLFSSVGANFAMRRSLYEELEGFDEFLGPGAQYESAQDWDLTYRAYLSGAGILLTPEIYVWHYGARDDAQWRRRLRAYGLGDGAFYGKHIRCRDLRLLSVFLNQVAKLVAREAMNPLRRKPAKLEYLKGCLIGLRRSWGQPIDRVSRLYVPSG